MVSVSASPDKDAQSKGPLHVVPEDIEQDGSVDSRTVIYTSSQWHLQSPYFAYIHIH